MRFRTTCVRVLRRGVQFVNIVDVGPVEQLQAFMVQKKKRKLEVSGLQFFLSCRQADHHDTEALGRRSTYPGCSVSTGQRCGGSCRPCKFLRRRLRDNAHICHASPLCTKSQFAAKRSCGNPGELKREDVRGFARSVVQENRRVLVDVSVRKRRKKEKEREKERKRKEGRKNTKEKKRMRGEERRGEERRRRYVAHRHRHYECGRKQMGTTSCG